MPPPNPFRMLADWFQARFGQPAQPAVQPRSVLHEGLLPPPDEPIVEPEALGPAARPAREASAAVVPPSATRANPGVSMPIVPGRDYADHPEEIELADLNPPPAVAAAEPTVKPKTQQNIPLGNGRSLRSLAGPMMYLAQAAANGYENMKRGIDRNGNRI